MRVRRRLLMMRILMMMDRGDLLIMIMRMGMSLVRNMPSRREWRRGRGRIVRMLMNDNLSMGRGRMIKSSLLRGMLRSG
jgi:hypothetical protein